MQGKYGLTRKPTFKSSAIFSTPETLISRMATVVISTLRSKSLALLMNSKTFSYAFLNLGLQTKLYTFMF